MGIQSIRRTIFLLFQCVFTTVAFLFSQNLFAQADNLGLPESIRCDGSIIEAGDLQSRVLAKCGEPADRVDHRAFSVIHSRYFSDRGAGRRLYDRFFLNFSDAGSMADHRSRLGCGVRDYSHILRQFAHSNVVSNSGWTGKRLILWPAGEEVVRGSSTSWECEVVSEDNISEWVYNLGPTRFVRVLTFRNGRLERIEMLGYGY